MAKKSRNRKYDYDDYGYYFPTSRPIKTEEGIQTRTARGKFGESWWAKRWLSVLESYGIGSRLQRGRSYARGGQVLNIEIMSGQVTARVQGSRPQPYDIEIHIKQISDSEWELALDAISQQAIFTAQLLNSEMPQEIETAFQSAGVSLFPAQLREITTECSCPDFANPCKHIAAVYYLLGEQFDVDPFMMFVLRGRTREAIIEALRARRAAAVGAVRSADESPIEVSPSLEAQIAEFWQMPEAEIALAIAPPKIEAALLRRLGASPGGTSKDLEAIYRAMTQFTLRKVFGGEEAADAPVEQRPVKAKSGRKRSLKST
jgi:uncharacterized Zn finger protein